jgi:hypothetical protein
MDAACLGRLTNALSIYRKRPEDIGDGRSRIRRDSISCVSASGVSRAVARVKSLDRKTIGADVLGAMFDQTESPAAWLLSEHGITQESVLNFISNHDRQGKE